MTTRIHGLTRLTLEEAPMVCHSCVWWQSKTGRRAKKDRWVERAEGDFGAWGSGFYDGDNRRIGFLQYGAGQFFPRPAGVAAGAPPGDARLAPRAAPVRRPS